MQKTVQAPLRADPEAPPREANGEHNKPFKGRVNSSSWPDNAMSRRNANRHSVGRKRRARARLIVPGMVAAPTLIVTAEAPVLRAPSPPDKVRHMADNVQRVEAVPAQRKEVVGAQAEAVAVAQKVVVGAGERVQKHQITGFVLDKKGIFLPFFPLPDYR